MCVLQEAEGGALASFTGTMRYSSGLIADQKRTAAALVRVSKMMSKVCWGGGVLLALHADRPSTAWQAVPACKPAQATITLYAACWEVCHVCSCVGWCLELGGIIQL